MSLSGFVFSTGGPYDRADLRPAQVVRDAINNVSIPQVVATLVPSLEPGDDTLYVQIEAPSIKVARRACTLAAETLTPPAFGALFLREAAERLAALDPGPPLVSVDRRETAALRAGLHLLAGVPQFFGDTTLLAILSDGGAQEPLDLAEVQALGERLADHMTRLAPVEQDPRPDPQDPQADP